MKNIILILSVIVSCGIFAGCSKKDQSCKPEIDAAPDTEVQALEQYLSANKIEATKDSHGFYYKIDAAGAADHPDACSEVSVNYKGTLTNGTIFDQNENIKFQIKTLVPGWVLGIPLIGKGGKITLYLPPSLGYGNSAPNGIPANSILIFSIDLVNVF
jgi:FKBP-type peptidyl-prolyl cis-trans isomerase FkpA